MSLKANFASFCRPIDTDAVDEGFLVEAAKRGDEDAFARLFHRHSARTYQSLLRILRDREDAQDALQEAFLKAFSHLSTFEGKARFSTWLMRIAINSALMELRRRRARCLVQLDGGDGEYATWHLNLADHGVDIHGACESAELRGHLTRAIRRLRPILREMLELQQNFNYSQEELAALINISVPAVKSRIYRARRALRMSLGRQRVLDRRSSDAVSR
jgi:RNA polymerase sigma factor (sigma-70 family)